MRSTAFAVSAGSGGSSSRRNTRSAAEKADCSSPTMLATSLIGPLNFLEYSTKDEMLPIEIAPPRYRIAPKKLTSESERLLTKLTEGPTRLP